MQDNRNTLALLLAWKQGWTNKHTKAALGDRMYTDARKYACAIYTRAHTHPCREALNSTKINVRGLTTVMVGRESSRVLVCKAVEDSFTPHRLVSKRTRKKGQRFSRREYFYWNSTEINSIDYGSFNLELPGHNCLFKQIPWSKSEAIAIRQMDWTKVLTNTWFMNRSDLINSNHFWLDFLSHIRRVGVTK